MVRPLEIAENKRERGNIRVGEISRKNTGGRKFKPGWGQKVRHNA